MQDLCTPELPHLVLFFTTLNIQILNFSLSYRKSGHISALNTCKTQPSVRKDSVSQIMSSQALLCLSQVGLKKRKLSSWLILSMTSAENIWVDCLILQRNLRFTPTLCIFCKQYINYFLLPLSSERFFSFFFLTHAFFLDVWSVAGSDWCMWLALWTEMKDGYMLTRTRFSFHVSHTAAAASD